MGDAYLRYEPRQGDDKRVMSIFPAEDVSIMRADVPRFFNEDFWSAYELWKNFKEFGLPFSGGWAEQPDYLVRTIRAIEDAVNAG